eukprot:731970-Pyramimonas_sp.AAC.1
MHSLPEQARAHQAWAQPPTVPAAFVNRRRNLRRVAVASARMLRASRELGLPTSILEAQEQEYS